MLDPDEIEAFEHADVVARQVARRLVNRFRPHIEFNDVVQELRVFVLEALPVVKEWIEKDDPAEIKKGQKRLAVSLARHGERFARRERAAILGYRQEDEWFASAAVVKELLPMVLAGGLDGMECAEKEQVRKPPTPAEGNNLPALIADIQAAWKAHPSSLLYSLYGTSEPPSRARLAEQYGISEVALTKRESKALGALVDFLGGASPW